MVTQTQMQEVGKQEVKVALLTPYLSENFSERETEEYVKKQIEKAAYEPDNFAGLKFLESDEHLVKLETRNNHTTYGPAFNHFAIAGSTAKSEAKIMSMMGSGLVVARFSIFYGGPSSYTDRLPEEAGYSIDIPKSVATARNLLTDDGFLDAIVSREEPAIRRSIENLNSGLDRPILITPYLSIALRRESKAE
jgi:hypothetical protein